MSTFQLSFRPCVRVAVCLWWRVRKENRTADLATQMFALEIIVLRNCFDKYLQLKFVKYLKGCMRNEKSSTHEN